MQFHQGGAIRSIYVIGKRLAPLARKRSPRSSLPERHASLRVARQSTTIVYRIWYPRLAVKPPRKMERI